MAGLADLRVLALTGSTEVLGCYPPTWGRRVSPVRGAVGGWCWLPGVSTQSRGTGPKLLDLGLFSEDLGVVCLPWPRLLVSPPEAIRRKGLSLDCGPCPVPAGLLLASRTAATTISVGALARGSRPRSARPMLRPPATTHALLLRGEVIGIAMAATIPEAVTLAHRGNEVPVGSPVCAGAMGTGQQALHRVC